MGRSRDTGWFYAVILIGFIARLIAGILGYNHPNFDFDSYRLVSDVLADGKNVYAGTTRYNYGPFWFNLIHLFDWVTLRNPNAFRWLLITFLSLVDMGIFLVLWARFGKITATLFFLNPISIIITGCHNQFDNAAILCGLGAVIIYGDEHGSPLTSRKLCGLLLLGVSLTVKHLFFAFPLWLAFKQKGAWEKLAVLVIPPAVFLLSFAPYWPGGHEGIINNVFLYGSSSNQVFNHLSTRFFYDFFVPLGVQCWFDAQTVWLLLLAFFGLLCRQKNSLDSLLVYTGVLVAFAPLTANQYLAIPIAFAAANFNPLFAIYFLFGLLHLLLNAGSGFFPVHALINRYDNYAVYTLCLAIAWYFWKSRLMAVFSWLRAEIKFQFPSRDK